MTKKKLNSKLIACDTSSHSGARTAPKGVAFAKIA